MNDSAKKLMQERQQNRHDIFDNKIPKRVPIEVYLSLPILAEIAGIDRKSVYWDPSLVKDTARNLCSTVPSDTCLYSGSVYTPVSSQTLESVNKVMSDTGYMQHPNTFCMYDNEYDELINDPYAFIIDKCVPRVYRNLDGTYNPGRNILALTQESLMKQAVAKKEMPMVMDLYDEFGYPTEEMGGFGRAPMDWIADQLRSFSGICVDVRRQRSKVIEALDAIYPMMYKIAVSPDLSNISRYATTSFQLHMATYLREKDFAEVWLPSWRRMVVDFSSLGIRCGAFLEHDWTRLLDYVYDLPTGSYFTFEYTDAKLIKEKLGKKHILGGGFPLKYITSCTKAEAADKTKEWLDIMAPGGQYIFSFDKGALAMSDINLENLTAVCETVRDYGVYDNAGTPAGEIFSKNDYVHSEMSEFVSRHYVTWDQYLKKYPNTPENAKPIVTAAERQLFSLMFVMTC